MLKNINQEKYHVPAGKIAVFQLTKTVLAFMSAASEAVLYRYIRSTSACPTCVTSHKYSHAGVNASACIFVVPVCVSSSVQNCLIEIHKTADSHSECAALLAQLGFVIYSY